MVLSQIEENALIAKVDVVRKSISHAGEKGRALEGEVISLVRSFLPMEYGLSTGFIVYHTDDGPRLSKCQESFALSSDDLDQYYPLFS